MIKFQVKLDRGEGNSRRRTEGEDCKIIHDFFLDTISLAFIHGNKRKLYNGIFLYYTYIFLRRIISGTCFRLLTESHRYDIKALSFSERVFISK